MVPGYVVRRGNELADSEQQVAIINLLPSILLRQIFGLVSPWWTGGCLTGDAQEQVEDSEEFCSGLCHDAAQLSWKACGSGFQPHCHKEID